MTFHYYAATKPRSNSDIIVESLYRPIFLLIYSSPLKSLLKGEIDVHIAIYKSTSKNLYDEMSFKTKSFSLKCLFYDAELYRLLKKAFSKLIRKRRYAPSCPGGHVSRSTMDKAQKAASGMLKPTICCASVYYWQTYLLPENRADIEPRHLFLDPVWYTPSDDENHMNLLGEQDWQNKQEGVPLAGGQKTT